MGATLAGLERRGLVERRPDPEDGRRSVMSLTDAGRQVLRSRRDAGTEHMAQALAAEFTREELAQLMVGGTADRATGSEASDAGGACTSGTTADRR